MGKRKAPPGAAGCIALEAFFGAAHSPVNAQVSTLAAAAPAGDGTPVFTAAGLRPWTVVAVEGDAVFTALAAGGGAGEGTAPNCRVTAVLMGEGCDAALPRVLMRVIVTTTGMPGGEPTPLVLELGSAAAATAGDCAVEYAAAHLGGNMEGVMARACEHWPVGMPYYHSIDDHHNPSRRHSGDDALLQFPDTLLLPRACAALGGGELEVVARHTIPAGTCFLYGGYGTDVHSDSTIVVDTGDDPITDPEDGMLLQGQSVARLINYFRGFAQEGNVSLSAATYETPDGEPNRVLTFFVANRTIVAGELVLATSYSRDYDLCLDRLSVMGGAFVSLNEAALRGLPEIDFAHETEDVVAVRAAPTGAVAYYLLLEEEAHGRWAAEPLMHTATAEGTTVLARKQGDVAPDTLDVRDLIPLAFGWDYKAESGSDEDRAHRLVVTGAL
eukprot:TRINITY_DN9895_c0_g1_i1.p1 TRINITY_DN9895_c0_g1~~TRINITY_DN9895_c0_g1_i1.p1  ORF type:complete len:442 (+),score=136.16 TRINITY_DN9895_c0_g1_i1:102-1427(+)